MKRHVVALGVILITLSTGGTAAASGPGADPSKPELRSALWRAGWAAQGTGYSRADGSGRVRELQRALRSLGYNAGSVDGLFGPRTDAAVRRFQAKHGLRVNGRAGRATRVELSRSIDAPPRSRAPLTRRASRLSAGRAIEPWNPAMSRGTGYSRPGGSERVRSLQAALGRLRHSPGRVDGLFGPKTELAVRRFQRRHELERDGIVGPKTLAQLAISTSERDTTGDSSAPPVRRAGGAPGQPAGAIGQRDAGGDVQVPLALAALLGALTLLALAALLGALTLLVLAIVATRRRGRSAHPAGIAHNDSYVEGRGEHVGAFAGFVIVFGHAQGEDGAGERTYLVDDPSRARPVWVRESELEADVVGTEGEEWASGGSALLPARRRPQAPRQRLGRATDGQPRDEEGRSERGEGVFHGT